MKTRIQLMSWLGLAGLVGLVLVAFSSATVTRTALAQPKPVIWNLPHVAAPSYYLITNLNAFAAKVKERSSGRMEIRVHPASSLYPGPEIVPALVEGRAEIGMVLTGYLTDILLELGVLELPFMTGSIDEHHRAARQLSAFYAERLASKGLKPLATYAWPSQQLFSNRPIRSLQDFKGTKIRVYGAETAELMRSLGSAPVSIPFGEVYVALQRNVVDGAVTSATNAEPMKFFEVSKYLDYWYFNGAGLEWLAVNQKAWDALPKDLQQVVLDSLREIRFEERMWEDTVAWDARAKKRAVELGMTVVDVPPTEIERARMQARSAWNAWLKRTGAQGKRALDLALKALGRSS